MKLQHEANSKIAELAERAHQEAIAYALDLETQTPYSYIADWKDGMKTPLSL